MISLFNFLKKTFRSRRMKCVSPPLVGAVLALLFGSNVFAASVVSITPSGWTFSNQLPYEATISNVINGQTIVTNSSGLSAIGYPTGVYDIFAKYENHATYSVINNAPTEGYADLMLYFGITVQGGASISDFTVIARPDSSSYSVKPYSLEYNSSEKSYSYVYQFTIPELGRGYSDILNIDITLSDSEYYHLSFGSDVSSDVNINSSSSLKNKLLKTYKISVSVFDGSWNNIRQNSDLGLINDSINQGNAISQSGINQDYNFHEQDRSDATQAGSDMAALGTQLETVKNKWEILWYPIEFTNLVFSAFRGSSTATYSARYANISGYTYNDTLGVLEPVISTARAAPRASGGTYITFPSFTLPVLGVTLWDSYTFDISTIKDSFPALFDALYVFVSMLEVWWFVGFLRQKYEEVFG